nr:retrotransposon protein, putative, unclassified [Tanacetum cinerariifolium]
MRPFGCLVIIFNTIDHLGKFDGEADEGLFVRYSTNNKVFRVNSRTRIVEENLHIKFSENTLNIAGSGLNWIFDIDTLTKSMNYKPFFVGNQSNGSADLLFSFSSKDSLGDGFKPSREEEKKDTKDPRNEDSVALITEEPRIEEEVYVCQPPGFEDSDFPDKVYKVEKALYGLHQAPRAWYETFSTYLLENRFQRGMIDKTLFITRDKTNILLLQVYVDDIIFGSTKKEMCIEFEKIMHKKFQMSSMRELTFFLRLQVKQKEDGIFISQDKYVNEILNKFGYFDVKTTSTPMETHKTLLKDEKGEDVDEQLNRSMIGSLTYLTFSRPDVMFATMVANSITEAKYIAASNFCGQVLWIQNQLLDSGYNFMQTKIHINNESTIYIVKNLVFHSKTKHIKIRHHFIRDSNEMKLIQMIKIHTD